MTFSYACSHTGKAWRNGALAASDVGMEESWNHGGLELAGTTDGGERWAGRVEDAVCGRRCVPGEAGAHGECDEQASIIIAVKLLHCIQTHRRPHHADQYGAPAINTRQPRQRLQIPTSRLSDRQSSVGPFENRPTIRYGSQRSSPAHTPALPDVMVVLVNITTGP